MDNLLCSRSGVSSSVIDQKSAPLLSPPCTEASARCPPRERAPTLRADEQPCLFVLRDWKWRRAETKAITWVCKRECAVIETQKPPASDPGSYLRPAAADGIQVGHGEDGFTGRGLDLASWLAG